jgi:hypothetical protein
MSDSRKAPISVTKPLGDDWVVTMEWPDGVEDGGPGRLVIEPVGKMPVGGLSSTVLRQIDFRDAIGQHRKQLAKSGRRTGPLQKLRDFERAQLRLALAEGVTDYYLAFLSWQYVQATGTGQANINDYMAALVGKPVGTVRGHLIRARQKGFLTGSHGRKGGELTEAADKVLEPYWPIHRAEFERLVGNAALDEVGVATPLQRVIDDEPKRRRSRKAITSRSET